MKKKLIITFFAIILLISSSCKFPVKSNDNNSDTVYIPFGNWKIIAVKNSDENFQLPEDFTWDLTFTPDNKFSSVTPYENVNGNISLESGKLKFETVTETQIIEFKQTNNEILILRKLKTDMFNPGLFMPAEADCIFGKGTNGDTDTTDPFAIYTNPDFFRYILLFQTTKESDISLIELAPLVPGEFIETAELTVDGIKVPLTEARNKKWYGNFSFPPGFTYNIMLTVDDINLYTATIEKPYLPEIDFSGFDFAGSNFLQWFPGGEADKQFFRGSVTFSENNHDYNITKYLNIPSEATSYLLPFQWIYHFHGLHTVSLNEMNTETDRDCSILFIAQDYFEKNRRTDQ